MSPPARVPDAAGFAAMLPSFDQFGMGWGDCGALAARVEELGYDSAFVGDHLRGRCPNLDAPLVLAAAAARTERMRLGFAILLLALRHPAWTAKTIGTLDAMAPGRILLGVGVGGEYAEEWEAGGVPISERGRRTDEQIEIVQALLRGEAVDHDGPFLAVRSPALDPVPGHSLPLLVGGRSDAAIARAARAGDAWMPVWVDAARITRAREVLDELAAGHGRVAPGITLMIFCCVTDDLADGRRTADAYVQGQYGMGLDRIERWCAIGGEEEVAGILQGYVDAGATGLVVVPLSDRPLAALERLAPVRDRLTGLQRGGAHADV